MMNSAAIRALAMATAIFSSAPARAAQLEFDCDVPADHFSSVSQDVANGGGVSGTITVAQMRTGDNLPVVGAGIFGADKRAIAGFQLIAADARAKSFDIMFNVSQDGDAKKGKVGEVDASSAITFTISLSASGKAVLTVNSNQFQADASVISGGRAMAFCSTAEFKFTNLTFSASGDVSGG